MTLDADDGIVDQGTFRLEEGIWVPAPITEFSVDVSSTSVGAFPTVYTFELEVPGEVWEDSYIELTIPESVDITSTRDLGQYCTKDVFAGFTYNSVHCRKDS
jgi:hypothetical protein